MDPLLEIAERHGLVVIEDAAESHGLKYKGRQCGSFGMASVFSFYANKHLTTGEGGMVVTDDDALAEKLRYFRNLTFQSDKRLGLEHANVLSAGCDGFITTSAIERNFGEAENIGQKISRSVPRSSAFATSTYTCHIQRQ
jgi:dTDP-4-amino-4,6-dideoxygalactose transaminase